MTTATQDLWCDIEGIAFHAHYWSEGHTSENGMSRVVIESKSDDFARSLYFDPSVGRSSPRSHKRTLLRNAAEAMDHFVAAFDLKGKS